MRALHKVGVVAASGLLRTGFRSPAAAPPGGSPQLGPPRHADTRTSWMSSRQLTTACAAAETAGTDIDNANKDDDDNVPTTLLVGSLQDAASCAMIRALLARGDWLETSVGTEASVSTSQGRGKAWVHAKSPVSLWSVESRLLDLDDVDIRWTEQEDSEGVHRARRRPRPSDVIFLSKHSAKSGVPALCVHPIGLPNVSQFDV